MPLPALPPSFRAAVEAALADAPPPTARGRRGAVSAGGAACDARPSLRQLAAFVADERARGAVYPRDDLVFAALELTPFDAVDVVLLGQDPYHGPGQAHGLALSVEPGVAPPPSLVNVFKELEADVGVRRPDNGSLEPWARRGVLLLNAALTVRDGEPGSHAAAWEPITDAIIRAIDARARPSVFVLWGAHARKKAALVDRARHRVVEGMHPSPLSASRGFFGSKPFSAIDAALRSLGRSPMDWSLPDLGVPIERRRARASAKSAADP